MSIAGNEGEVNHYEGGVASNSAVDGQQSRCSAAEVAVGSSSSKQGRLTRAWRTAISRGEKEKIRRNDL